MGIGAVVLIIVMFVITRVLKQVGETMRTGGTLPPRAPGAAPQTMAELLVEMQQQLEAARRKEMAKRLPTQTAERGGSIEVAGRDDETIVVIDRDDDVEALVQRRIDAATARNGEWRASDHARFDKQIRQAAPAPTPAKPRTALRQAMIWREVLGPPVALRQDEPL